MKRKINLSSNLVHRALIIYSESTLQNKFSSIPTILINNGYPESVINIVITKKMYQTRRPIQFGPRKCPVYLHLPWLGNVSMKYEMQITTAVKRCYFAVESLIVYITRHQKTLHINATLFINFCATVIVSTWVVLLKGCHRGLSSTYPKPFFRDLLLKTEVHSPALAKALKLKLLSPL